MSCVTRLNVAQRITRNGGLPLVVRCFILIASLLVSAVQAEDEKAPRKGDQESSEQKITRALDSQTTLEFPDNTLKEVVDFIQQLHNIPIRLDEQALTDAGLEEDVRINIAISGITLRSALKLMLNNVKGTELTFVIQDEVLKITTAEKANKNSLKVPGKPGTGKLADLKPEQEAAALAFAGEHHPELKTLVESLKSANPDGYKKAIHDLYRTQERLTKLQGTKPGAVSRYDHELALWKLDSRIRVTAARSAMKATDELRAELKTLVEQRQALSLSQLKVDREQTAARLAKLDEQLKSAEANPGQSVEAEVDRLLNSAKTKKPEVTANFKADKQKKPGQGEGKPKGEAKPGEGKPKGEAKPGEGKPKGEKPPSEPEPKPKTP